VKNAILILIILATACVVVSVATIGGKATITLSFLPEEVRQVPYHFAFGTLALILGIVSLALAGRSWERDELPESFTDKIKYWGMTVVLLASLPAMIFLGFVIQEAKEKPKPEKRPPYERHHRG
jgi:hypothetical protein